VPDATRAPSGVLVFAIDDAFSWGGDMKRRDFISLLGGAVATWPLAARAQQPAMPVIGFLHGASAWEYAQAAAAFRQGLSETGHVEGRNALVEYRWAEGHYDRLPVLAADLVRRQVAVIAAGGNAAVRAAKAATATTAIVFYVGGNPIELGLVASLNRPGGNATGVVSLNDELGPKRLELVHGLVPAATTIAALVNPTNPGLDSQSRDLQAAARVLAVQVQLLHASTEHEIDVAFGSLERLQAAALVIASDAFFNGRSEQFAALALRHRMPTIFQFRDFAAAGGLMSYGGDLTDQYRLVGVYAGRILKGEKTTDLPVQQSTKVELIINLKTAKALGLTVPLSLLGRADEVIE
jgi:putative tryptophan/tyrosine transport system substrate-binding protein